MKPKSKAEIELTINKASTLTGIDRRVLEKRLLDVGVAKSAKYRLADIFRAIQSEYSKGRTRVAVATAERMEMENRKRSGELIQKEIVRTWIMTANGHFWSELERHFTIELPPTLVGLDERSIARISRERVYQLADSMRDYYNKELAKYEKAEEPNKTK